MEEELRDIEFLEEDLSDTASIGKWIVGRFGKKDWMRLGIRLQVLENVPPNSFHAVPVFDHAMLHRVTQLNQSPEFFLISEIDSIKALSITLTAALPMKISLSFAPSMDCLYFGRPTLSTETLASMQSYLLGLEVECRFLLTSESSFHDS